MEELEKAGERGVYRDYDYDPYQLAYDAVGGVKVQYEGSREEDDRKQGDTEVNFTKEDLQSVEDILECMHPSIQREAQEALRRVMWRDHAGDLNLYTIPQHERELMHISELIQQWYRSSAEYEREQMGEDRWWEGVEDTAPTCMHLKVTNKRTGKDDEVYIYECKNSTQKLVDTVDQVILQIDIMVWGGTSTSSSGQHGNQGKK